MNEERIQEGYIILARKIRKSPLWQSLKANHRLVMIELLLQAQFQDGEVARNGEILHLKRGQIATSYQQIVDDIGDKEITVKIVRNAITKLEKYNFLAKDEAKVRAKKGLLVTLVNYGFYQNPDNYKGKVTDKVEGKEGAEQGQSEGKEGAINNNVNNVKNEKNDNNSSCHKYEICDMENAELLFQEILTNNPAFKKPNLDKWANEFRLIREKDKRTDEQIKFLITWVQADSFWKSNILSPAKLRKQFDALVIKIKAEREAKPKKGNAGQPKEEDFNLDD